MYCLPFIWLFYLNSNRFAIGEDSLQTSQDLQKYNTTLDGNEITHNTGSRPNNDDIDDKEYSEPNTIINHNVKPSHKTGRGINLKYMCLNICVMQYYWIIMLAEYLRVCCSCFLPSKIPPVCTSSWIFTSSIWKYVYLVEIYDFYVFVW